MKIKSVKNLNELMMRHGQDITMSAKRAVWKAKGLDTRWGIYTGTPKQINVLVNSLKDNPISFSSLADSLKPLTSTFTNVVQPKTATAASTPVVPDWQLAIDKAFSSSKTKTPTAPLPTATTESPNMSVVPTSQTPLPIQTKTDVANLQKVTPPPAPQYSPAGGIGTQDKGYEFMSKGTWKPTTAKEAVSGAASATEMMNRGIANITGQTKEVAQPQVEEPKYTAQDALTAFNIPSATPSEADILDQVMNSEEFKLAQEKLGLTTMTAEGTAEAAKAALESKFGADKTKLENNLASSGLAFSGIRTSQVQGLIDELASSKLGVDRKFAQALLGANIDLKEAILKAAGKVITDAKAGRTEAVAQLNKLGMAVIGDTLMPIPEKETFNNVRSVDGGLYDLRTGKFIVAPTKTPRVSDIIAGERVNAENKLLSSRGEDGFADPNTYMSLRTKGAMSPTEFDKRYSYMLSDAEQQRLGITKSDSQSAWEYDQGVWQWLAENSDLSDEEKASNIMAAGRNPQSFGIYGY